MTSLEFIKAIQEYCDENVMAITIEDVRLVVEGYANAVTSVVQEAGTVTLPGIGRVTCKVADARKSRNPQTGEAIDVPAKVRVSIKPSISLKKSVPEASQVKTK